jgi:hypothetical protein
MRYALAAVLIAACGGSHPGGGDDAAAPDAPAGQVVLPTANAGFDYQLGGAYDPPAGVTIVSRDRTEDPAPGLYGVCYVNGFQTQGTDMDFWLNEHPDLVLRDGGGNPVFDPDWPDEMLLDITTPEKRTALAEIIGGWIDGCAAAGYRATEMDNLDTYSRSNGAITTDDAVAMAALLSARAHADGLAIAQKNALEIIDRKDEMGFDFQVAEECNAFDECDGYVAAYGDLVFVIEYDDPSFATGCANYPNLSIIRRDRDLTTPGDAAYVYDGC